MLVNNKRSALDAHDLFAVHILLLPHAVGLRDLLIYVAEEQEGEALGLFEFGLSLGRIGRDADHHGILLFNLPDGVAKLARFSRSTGSAGARKEVQNHFLSTQTPEVERFAGIALNLDVGSLIAFFEHGYDSAQLLSQ
jgi:hypothetical protein